MPAAELRFKKHSSSLAGVIAALFGALQKFTLPLVDLFDQQREAAFRAGAFHRKIPEGELAFRILIA